MIPIFVVLVLSVFVAMTVKWLGDRAEKEHDTSRAWQEAISSETSQVGRMLLAAARPLSNVPQIYERSVSPQYRWLQSKLLASGGTFANSVEVFLAVQVFCFLLATMITVGLILSDVAGMGLIAGVVFSIALVIYPYNVVTERTKKRVKSIDEGLPQFADLLQMPLSAGLGVIPAMAFTVERIDGVVAEEVENMLGLLRSRALTDSQAFLLCAERIGTPEAASFFTALMQAHVEGAKVAKNLQAQAEALRTAAHQKRRAANLKLPTKISIAVAVHIMPLLFAITFIPLFHSLGSM